MTRDIIERLLGDYNDRSNPQIFEDAAAEIRRLRVDKAMLCRLAQRVATFIEEKDPFGDYFSENDLKQIELARRALEPKP